jgi:hypothetical protein
MSANPVVFNFIMLTISGNKSKAVSLHAMVAPGGERRYSSYSFLTTTLDGVSGQRHAPAALCPGEMTPDTHYTGGWVGLRAGLDTEIRRKSFAPAGDRTPIAQALCTCGFVMIIIECVWSDVGIDTLFPVSLQLIWALSSSVLKSLNHTQLDTGCPSSSLRE